MNTNGIIADLENLAKEFRMDRVGLATLSRPQTMDYYWTWLQDQMHASMSYLETHAPVKEKPQTQWPRAKSAVVFTKNYFPHPQGPAALKASRLALYAQGADYHHWFKNTLLQIAQRLKTQWPTHDFVAITDSGPVLERDLAHRAGLGWFGKNTCLIHPKQGSLFFIGEIYTTLAINSEPVPTLPDFCGTCRRCLDICPTQALQAPHRLDARRCISFLTIESKDVPPVELREKIGDWLFGCDLCQTVCPWNQKFFKDTLSTDLIKNLGPASRRELIEELRFLLTASGKKLLKQFHGSAVSRAGAFGLRRNALIVAANQQLSELYPEIIAWQEDARLGELAKWALAKLSKV